MKVFSKIIAGHSCCYVKIIGALQKYAPPNIVFVNNTGEADLVILHINGRLDRFARYAEYLKSHGKKYIMAQYCIRGTTHPKTESWRHLWENAEMVWSYYPLDKYIEEEGGKFSIPNFYHSPLGCDESIFSNHGNEKKEYIMMSSGYNSGQSRIECAGEIYQAASNVGKIVFHLGRTKKPPKNVVVGRNLSDNELASIYRSCSFVAGLRRVEAFEIGVVEGLFCGVRPIVFDRPHYRIWHDKWAEFIPESTSEVVVENLTRIFKEGARPVTKEEIEEAVEKFGWRNLIPEFWRRVL